MNNSINSRLDNGVLRLAEQAKQTPGKPAQSEVQSRSFTAAKQPDKLELTAKARTLKDIEEQVRKAPDVDSQRVAELKQSITNGTYEVNPARIADKLLALDALLPK